jgi:hypothetical protein
MSYRMLLLFASILLASCAGKPFPGGPIVDMKGVDPMQYRVDLDECGVYADQVAVGQQAAAGAVAGAVLGGLIGAAVGNSESAKEAAGAGAVFGGAKGAGRGIGERRTVVRTCLRHRGYAVLN